MERRVQKVHTGIQQINTNYSKIANISIKAIVNAIGKQPNYAKQNTNGTLTYVNESNAFGAGEKLTRNAILTYSYLHFLNPNSNAHVLLDEAEAMSFLGLSKRTLRNNLGVLERRNYIRFVEGILDGTYDIYIEYYEENGLKASESGRGYLALPFTTFKSLLNLKTLNKLRFALRSLIDTVPGKQQIGLHDGCTLTSLLRCFPSYTRKKDLLNLFADQTLNKLLDIKVSVSYKYCTVRLKNPVDPKAELVENTKRKLSSLFTSLNLKHPENQFVPTAKELLDISKIAFRQPMQAIEAAIRKLYYNYSRDTVKNLPALIRTLSTE